MYTLEQIADLAYERDLDVAQTARIVLALQMLHAIEAYDEAFKREYLKCV